jgi:hypothetical protein
MTNLLLLNDADAQAMLWAIENAIADQAEWIEEHEPSEWGENWLAHSQGIRLNLERLAIALTERIWPDARRAAQLAEDACKLGAEILLKCAADSARMSAGRASAAEAKEA